MRIEGNADVQFLKTELRGSIEVEHLGDFDFVRFVYYQNSLARFQESLTSEQLRDSGITIVLLR